MKNLTKLSSNSIRYFWLFLLVSCGSDINTSESTDPENNSSGQESQSKETSVSSSVWKGRNVWTESSRWYVNPAWSSQVKASGGAAVAEYSTAVWLESIYDVEDPGLVLPQYLGVEPRPTDGMYLYDHMLEARKQGNALIQLVIRNAPARNCHSESSLAELPLSADGVKMYRQSFIDPIVSTLREFPEVPVVAIVEPFSFLKMLHNIQSERCENAWNQGNMGYVPNVRYAIQALSKLDNVRIYLDMDGPENFRLLEQVHMAALFTHGVLEGLDGLQQKIQLKDVSELDYSSQWMAPAYELLQEPTISESEQKVPPPGYAAIDGFVTNLKGYVPLAEPYLKGIEFADHYFYGGSHFYGAKDYAEAWMASIQGLSQEASHLGYIVDTGRNGWGQSQQMLQGKQPVTDIALIDQYRVDQRIYRGNTCNQSGGLGRAPGGNESTDFPRLHAYIWGWPPGISDGASSYDIVIDEPFLSCKSAFDYLCASYDYNPDALQDPATEHLELTTEAMPNAPLFGRWYEMGFKTLYKNAWPSLCSSEEFKAEEICL